MAVSQHCAYFLFFHHLSPPSLEITYHKLYPISLKTENSHVELAKQLKKIYVKKRDRKRSQTQFKRQIQAETVRV
jgi:hypothetical protein